MTILDSLKEALEQRGSLRVSNTGEYTPYDLKVIVALFMLSAGNADGNITREERIEMLKALERQFNFTDEQAAQILDVAEFLLEKDKDIEEFACQVRENFQESQRVTLLAMYIQVLEADGVVTVDEMKGIEQVLNLLALDRSSIDKAKEKLALQKKEKEEESENEVSSAEH